jgi:hypothetical protein
MLTTFKPTAIAAVFLLTNIPLLTGADGSIPATHGLIAHEWGTFTTVAGEDGNPMMWRPLASADLPCFVERLHPFRPKSSTFTTVRMETPVIYFYSKRPERVSVRVDMPGGLITEWYPSASANRGGRIEWNNVQLLADPSLNEPVYPVTKGDSHYYPARATDATPLTASGQTEKLLFYRGVGNFDVPVHARFDDAGRLRVKVYGGGALPVAIYFENRGEGRVGFRVARDLREGDLVWDAPEVRADGEAEVRQLLREELVRAGLFPKEAAAMVETWRDSWFETGTRVLYLAPRAMVDRVLPLQIQPGPVAVERVFAGRVELLAPWRAEELRRTTDAAVMLRAGRFLDSFYAMIQRGSGGVRLNAAAYGAAAKKMWDESLAGCVR